MSKKEKIDTDIPKAEYKPKYDALINELIILQQRAREKELGVVVLLEGYLLAEKGTRLSELMSNLDARAVRVEALDTDVLGTYRKMIALGMKTKGEEHPMKRFWDGLGQKGVITFYDDGWYTNQTCSAMITAKGDKAKTKEYALQSLEQIKSFERQLAADGYLIIKFFFDLDEKENQKRINNFEKKYKKNAENDIIPLGSSWNLKDVGGIRKKFAPLFGEIYDNMLEETNDSYAPWVMLNAANKRETRLKMAQTLVDTLKNALEQTDAQAENNVQAGDISAAPAEIESRFEIEENYPRFEDFKYDLVCPREEYSIQLKVLQHKLSVLQRKAFLRGIPIIVMYEGWDAAGKGGNIKRLAQALDARGYSIATSPAPTKLELAHPFLWRYWTRIPDAGEMTLFDRSWYGRVLVERVEGFAKPAEWMRAFDEINEFERDLVDWGAVLVKFWVEIDQDEQLKRFQARQENPDKQWKITDEDWRNREKYEPYKVATADMFRLTSTVAAPWTILESNDKCYARIKALTTVIEAIEKKLAE